MGQGSSKQRRILMLGLDGAGKTTILFALKVGHPVKTIPTVGFNLEEITVQGIKLTIWDCGGQEKIRNTWRYYYEGTEALIFVVDSQDKDRVAEARKELHKLLGEEMLQECTLLVFANKQDLPGHLTGAEVTELLELESLPGQRVWKVQEAIAKDNTGLKEGLSWLSTTLPQSSCAIL